MVYLDYGVIPLGQQAVGIIAHDSERARRMSTELVVREQCEQALEPFVASIVAPDNQAAGNLCAQSIDGLGGNRVAAHPAD
jgi:hypothetical protein